MSSPGERDLALTKRVLGNWVRTQRDLALKSRGRIVLRNLKRFRDARDDETRRILIENVASLRAAIQASRRRTSAGARELIQEIDREIARARLYGEYGEEVRSAAHAAVLAGESPAIAVSEARRTLTNAWLDKKHKEPSLGELAASEELGSDEGDDDE